MNKYQQLFNVLRETNISNGAWLDVFDDITDGLDNPSVEDLARAVAATCVRCGTEPDWNTFAKLMPESMDTLVHAYQAYQDDGRTVTSSRQVAA
ncbi:MAG: hypothetical protein ACYDB0_05580 [Acidithiobacillus sp.]